MLYFLTFCAGEWLLGKLTVCMFPWGREWGYPVYTACWVLVRAANIGAGLSLTATDACLVPCLVSCFYTGSEFQARFQRYVSDELFSCKMSEPSAGLSMRQLSVDWMEKIINQSWGYQKSWPFQPMWSSTIRSYLTNIVQIFHSIGRNSCHSVTTTSWC